MSDRYFLDTNVFVYCFDRGARRKQEIADKLVTDALRDHRGVISYQVIQEFLNVATRRFATPMSPGDSENYLREILAPLCEVYPTVGLYERALHAQARWGFSFYDALIIASALQAGCAVLHSEDLHGGQKLDGLTVKNPFVQ